MTQIIIKITAHNLLEGFKKNLEKRNKISEKGIEILNKLSFLLIKIMLIIVKMIPKKILIMLAVIFFFPEFKKFEIPKEIKIIRGIESITKVLTSVCLYNSITNTVFEVNQNKVKT